MVARTSFVVFKWDIVDCDGGLGITIVIIIITA